MHFDGSSEAAPFIPPESSQWRNVDDMDFDKAPSTILVLSADGETYYGRDVRIISLLELFVHAVQNGFDVTAELPQVTVVGSLG